MESLRSIRIRAATGAALAVASLSMSHFAAATEAGFYVGALAGQSETDIDKSSADALIRSEFGPVLSSSTDESDTAFGVFAGYQFLPWLAVEAAYQDLGEATYQASTSVFVSPPPRFVPVATEIKSEVKAASVSALFIAPLGDQFALGASLGVASTDAKFTVSANAPGVPGASASDSASQTNTSGVFGVHFEWAPMPQLGVRVQYQRYKDVGGDSDEDVDGFDVTVLSANALWRF